MTPERHKHLMTLARNRQPDVSVILENVHDLHNVGAVMRTCDATGVDAVNMILADVYTKSKKQIGKYTSSGARKWVEAFEYPNINSAVQNLRTEGVQILGTMLADNAVSLYEIDFTKPTMIIFGNEKRGLSTEAQALIDQPIMIPQYGLVQSLNISVACAVTLYEMMRQRQAAGLYERLEDNVVTIEYYEKYVEMMKRKYYGVVQQRGEEE